jgi:hypothetical protein
MYWANVLGGDGSLLSGIRYFFETCDIRGYIRGTKVQGISYSAFGRPKRRRTVAIRDAFIVVLYLARQVMVHVFGVRLMAAYAVL